MNGLKNHHHNQQLRKFPCQTQMQFPSQAQMIFWSLRVSLLNVWSYICTKICWYDYVFIYV